MKKTQNAHSVGNPFCCFKSAPLKLPELDFSLDARSVLEGVLEEGMKRNAVRFSKVQNRDR